MLKIVVKNVGEAPKVMEIEDTLQNLQKLVGGYIEALPYRDMYLICNEEGKLQGLPYNFTLTDTENRPLDNIVGNVFFVDGNNETAEFESITEQQIKDLMNTFDTIK